LKRLPRSISPFTGNLYLEELEYYDVIIRTQSLDLLESEKKSVQRCKTNVDFDYNNFDARGSITVVSSAGYAITDACIGQTGGATGTIYEIDGNTIYLKDVTGTWQDNELLTAGGTLTTSTLTVIAFPFFLDNMLERKDYDLDYNESVGGEFWVWIRIEARWTF